MDLLMLQTGVSGQYKEPKKSYIEYVKPFLITFFIVEIRIIFAQDHYHCCHITDGQFSVNQQLMTGDHFSCLLSGP